MKNLNYLFFALALGVCAISSCDEEPVNNGPNPNGEALKQSFQDHREAATQHFEVDLSSSTTGVVITGEQGTKFTFYPGGISDASGNMVTGVFDVELIEIYDKANMLLLNKPSVGILPSGDRAMLVSGGEFSIKASQGGAELFINGGLVFEVPSANTGGLDADMVLFSNALCCDADCDLIVCENNAWTEEADSAGQGNLWPNSLGNYEGVIDSFQWTNVDRFYDDPAPKTTLLVQAPAEYDGSNLGVFISVDGEENLLAALDHFIEADQLFSEHYGQMPIGLAIHIIALSIVEDQYYYTIKAATITDGGIIVLDDLSAISEASFVTEVNNLP